KTGCPGCGRPIEIRENDPQFFEARFRTKGGDALKIPGRCGVCGGPPPREKKGRAPASGPAAGAPDDEARGRRAGGRKAGTVDFFGHRVPVWILIVVAVSALVMLRFLLAFGLRRVH